MDIQLKLRFATIYNYFLISSLPDLSNHHLSDLLVRHLHLVLSVERSITVGRAPYIYRPVTPSSVRLAGAGGSPSSSPVSGKINHCRKGTLHNYTDLSHLSDLLVLEGHLHLVLSMERSITVGRAPYIIYRPVTPYSLWLTSTNASVWLTSAAAGELPASSRTNGKIKHCGLKCYTQTRPTTVCLIDLCLCGRNACVKCKDKDRHSYNYQTCHSIICQNHHVCCCRATCILTCD